MLVASTASRQSGAPRGAASRSKVRAFSCADDRLVSWATAGWRRAPAAAAAEPEEPDAGSAAAPRAA